MCLDFVAAVSSETFFPGELLIKHWRVSCLKTALVPWHSKEHSNSEGWEAEALHGLCHDFV